MGDYVTNEGYVRRGGSGVQGKGRADETRRTDFCGRKIRELSDRCDSSNEQVLHSFRDVISNVRMWTLAGWRDCAGLVL